MAFARLLKPAGLVLGCAVLAVLAAGVVPPAARGEKPTADERPAPIPPVPQLPSLPQLPGVPALNAGANNAAAGGGGGSILDGCLPASTHATRLLNLCIEQSDYKGPKILFLASSSQNVQNACATFIRPQQFNAQVQGLPDGPTAALPAILYNPTFMTQMSFATDNEFVCVYVLAHELGHIVCGHVDPARPVENNMHPWEQELEADRFAGKICAKLGAKPKELEMAHRVMVSSQWIQVKQQNGRATVQFADKNMRVSDLITGSKTHPDAIRRVRAIAQGWREGGGEGDVEDDLAEIFTKMVKQLTRWEPGM